MPYEATARDTHGSCLLPQLQPSIISCPTFALQAPIAIPAILSSLIYEPL